MRYSNQNDETVSTIYADPYPVLDDILPCAIYYHYHRLGALLAMVTLLAFIAWIFGIYTLGHATLALLNLGQTRGITAFILRYWLGYGTLSLLLFSAASLKLLTLHMITFVLFLAVPYYIYSARKGVSFSLPNSQHTVSILFIVTALIPLPFLLNSDTLPIVSLFADNGLPKNDMGSFFAGPGGDFLIQSAAQRLAGPALPQLHIWFSFVCLGLTVFHLAHTRLRVASSWVVATTAIALPLYVSPESITLSLSAQTSLFTLSLWSLVNYSRSARHSWLLLAAILSAITLHISHLGYYIFITLALTTLLCAKNLPWRRQLSDNTLFILTGIAYAAPWFLWTYSHTGNPFFPFWETSADSLTFKETYLTTDFAFSLDAPTLWQKITSLYQQEEAPLYSLVLLITSLPVLLRFAARFPFMSWEKVVSSTEIYVASGVMFILIWSMWGYNTHPRFGLVVLPISLFAFWVIATQLSARSTLFIRNGYLITLMSLLALLLGNNVAQHKNAWHSLSWNSLSWNSLSWNTLNPFSTAMSTQQAYVAKYTSLLNTDERLIVTGGNDIPSETRLPLSPKKTTVSILNALMAEQVTYWIVFPPTTDDTSYEDEYHILSSLQELGCFVQLPQTSVETYQFSPFCAGKITPRSSSKPFNSAPTLDK